MYSGPNTVSKGKTNKDKCGTRFCLDLINSHHGAAAAGDDKHGVRNQETDIWKKIEKLQEISGRIMSCRETCQKLQFKKDIEKKSA